MYNILLAGLADDLCDVYISLTACSLVKPHKATPLLAKNNNNKKKTRAAGAECFLHFSLVCKCPDCFIKV